MVKLRQNMAIFRFFKMAADAILNFHILKILTPERSIWPNCVNVPNFVEIGYFSILQDGGRRHVGFSNFRKF